MFGILAPCPSRTPDDLKPRWMGHFCGLCLELRDDAGHLSRLTTNYDTLALSVLVEAQQGSEAGGRDAGPCALRGMRRQRIATGGGPRLAAAASLLLASAKLRDHVEDGDGFVARRGVAGLAGRAAGRYRSKALAIGESIGLPVEQIMASVDRQQAVEGACGPGTPLAEVTAPTERATADLFAHAAVLGGNEDNTGPFRAAGAAFGRLAHLLDAAEDFEDDAEHGAWNPLAATGTGLDEARSLARGALADMRMALEAASFVDEAMVRLLLDRYASHAVSKTFGSTCATYRRPERRSGHHEYHDDMGRKTTPRGFWAGLCVGIGLCCSCQCCCKERYEGAWSRKPREGCCRDCCDCSCCECCACDCS
ncbi:DUF5685 family protein [Glycomyces arizonensis]|uniref:DUF5685 family protein n=1 Tax=Glycomyces arizonensis TaxID=256035 RepID=UPI00040C69BA|nr:DUF5685 family protein [Glycomyces arizonensis]